MTRRPRNPMTSPSGTSPIHAKSLTPSHSGRWHMKTCLGLSPTGQPSGPGNAPRAIVPPLRSVVRRERKNEKGELRQTRKVLTRDGAQLTSNHGLARTFHESRISTPLFGGRKRFRPSPDGTRYAVPCRQSRDIAGGSEKSSVPALVHPEPRNPSTQPQKEARPHPDSDPFSCSNYRRGSFFSCRRRVCFSSSKRASQCDKLQ
ncbi:hypothetical protein B0I37DRAFT_131346 [Chaetomium sp. MPI-CAGE-AT-0009]|nr:hypothetical protein B0I37DRAFT_131346 [Chaetomium sp. MPI-CAGE-AT-0009]